LKFNNKTVGVARQQRHFLCGDKENEAKESLALRWAGLARGLLVASVIGMNFSCLHIPSYPRGP
jgi:hypothetical protein